MSDAVTLRHAGSPAQLEFWNMQRRFRAFVGGVGSGKTRAGVVEVLRQPAGSRGAVVAPTYRMLADATLRTFLEIARPMLAEMPSASLLADFSKSDLVITLVNGTEVLFRSSDNPDALRGPNLGWFWLDEAAMMPEMALDVMLGRLRLAPRRAWVTTSPRGFNWVWRVFEQSPTEEYGIVRCSSRANPFVEAGFVQTLEARYKGAFASQDIEGEFVEFVETPCYVFRRERNVEVGLRAQYQSDRPLILCCDFNVRWMAWPIVQAFRGRPHVIGEVVVDAKRQPERVATVEAAVREFRNQFPAHAGGVMVYGDAAGQARTRQAGGRSDYDALELAFASYSSPVRLCVPAANPPVKDRIAAVNRMLTGTDMLPVLKVDGEHCPHLVLDFLQTQWNKRGDAEEQVSNPEDERSRLTHETSALGYYLHREFPVSAERAAVAARAYRPLPPARAPRVLGAI